MAREYTLSFRFDVLDRGSAALKKLGQSFKRLAFQLKPLSGTFKKIGVSARGAFASMRTSMQSLGKSWRNIPLIGRFGLGYLGTKILGMSMDFNKAMANVGTLIPGNIKRLEDLKGAVQDLSQEMGISTDDMAGGLYEVVSAFGDSTDAGQDTMEKLKVVASAAKAGLASTSDSLNLLSQVVKDYGDTSVAGMKKASDLAFATVKYGQTNFEALAQSMAMVIPTAARLKVSQEELFATMATFTRGARTTPFVVTQLNATLSALMNPTEAMSDRIRKLGYDSGTAMLETEGLGKTMALLTDNGNLSKETLGEMFGNVRALRLAMSFSGPQMRDYNDKLKAMQNVSGATSIALKEQTDGINKTGHAWAKAKVSMTIAAQALGDLLGPAIEKVAQLITVLSSSLSAVFSGKIFKNIGRFIGTSAELVKESASKGGIGVGGIFSVLKSDPEMMAKYGSKFVRLKEEQEKLGGYKTVGWADKRSEDLDKFMKYMEQKEKEKVQLDIRLPVDDEGRPILQIGGTKGSEKFNVRPQAASNTIRTEGM